MSKQVAVILAGCGVYYWPEILNTVTERKAIDGLGDEINLITRRSILMESNIFHQM